ncbi:MAG TPA: M6 family metalloprotease domain-containing protein [Candidatus Krumholzibacteria bacterium]
MKTSPDEESGQFEFKHAWIEKARRVRENRERFIQDRGFYTRELLAPAEQRRFAVTGTIAVPTFCVKFSDTGPDPYPVSTLQTKLYDGPFSPRTVTEYYREISYGDLTVTGTVYGWTTLPEPESYYAGSGTCNGRCSGGQELVRTTVAANDAAIDFGQYDNDGADGIPNSGDDDGYVDFVSIVQPEPGAECNALNGHIWSHRSFLYGDFVTNDPRAGGGNIKVSDYVIQPAYNCNGSVISIGVFCHEYGHAFGLPDLYDTDGGSQGVGAWCLMGTGGDNTSSSPAHMCAWSKSRLGWVDITVVPSVSTPFSIFNVETNRTVYRLDVMHERWRRTPDCAIAGKYSMRCALTESEAAGRNWPGGSGYGNRWDQLLTRDFDYTDGSVTLSYTYAYETERNFDFAYARVRTGGVTTTLATYQGTGSGSEVLDITPFLVPHTPYTIEFRFTSDGGYSDEDGSKPTTCGAFIVDDIAVMGGGVTHTANFETREDGWAEDMTNPIEYFLVENRQPVGSDARVWGGGGLVIWHIDSGVQSGGPDNDIPHRVAVEQADGLFDLEHARDRGDEGDAYPGSTNNRVFNGDSNPSSDGHDGPSHVSVGITSGNGDPITAWMRGGWPPPSPATVSPVNTSAPAFALTINGAGMARSCTVELVRGNATFAATSVTWLGKDQVRAQFNTTGAANGFYDVVVYNPGGASSMLDDVFEIKNSVAAPGPAPPRFELMPNYPNPLNPSTTIRYRIASREHVKLVIYDVRGTPIRTLVNESKPAGSYALQWNGRDDRGVAVSSGVYFYRITAGSFSDVRKMTLLK